MTTENNPLEIEETIIGATEKATIVEAKQSQGLTKMQKIWGVLFILSIVFMCCTFTPLSPAGLVAKVFSPVIKPVVRDQAISVARLYYIPLETFLAGLISLIGGCFTGIVMFVGFVGATLTKWRSEGIEERRSILELQKLQYELEKQRFQLEKQRVELEQKKKQDVNLSEEADR